MSDIKQEALAHYDRMIEWAEKNKERYDDKFFHAHSAGASYRLSQIMLSEIGENWSGRFCSYCDLFFRFCSEKICVDCPLMSKRSLCCDGAWSKTGDSKNINHLIDNLKRVRNYIQEHG